MLVKKSKGVLYDTVGRLPQKNFRADLNKALPIPNLIDSQAEAYNYFLEKELKLVLQDFSPIDDHSKQKFSISFLDVKILEPKMNEDEARYNKTSFVSPIKVKIKFENKITKKSMTQELSFGSIPKMTERGTFIINGGERLIVSQLTRSKGFIFNYSNQLLHLFGAKIMPERGPWFVFETTSKKDLIVKINKGAKLYVTTLLRAAGYKTDKSIIDGATNSFAKEALKQLLEQDTIETFEEACVAINTNMRPTDQPTKASAVAFVREIFSPTRLDISELGRMRFNKVFGGNKNPTIAENRTVTKEDIMNIVSTIYEKNNTKGAEADDIDHLEFRRIRHINEFMLEYIRKGLAKVQRYTKDRMSNIDNETEIPLHIVNTNPFQIAINDFFKGDKLSHAVRQENLLDELEHLRNISALGSGGLTREHAGVDVRDLHPSHYGRICPVHTPDGENIGLTNFLALYARTNKFGIIETPYIEIKDGTITDNIVYMDARTEMSYYIAAATSSIQNNKLHDKTVNVRYQGEPMRVDKKQVQFIDVASNQLLSVAAGLIPFFENTSSHRTQYGSTTQRQALPCLVPQAPLVATGIEKAISTATKRVVVAPEAGEITYIDGNKVTLKTKNGNTEYKLKKFEHINSGKMHHQRPNVSLGQKVKKGDIIVDSASTDNGQLAIGQNLRTCFMCWSGCNYEDAIVLSNRVVSDDVFTSLHIKEYECSVYETKLGQETTTCDIPNVAENRLRNLDERGIIRIGADVYTGDILVGKITPKGETQFTPEERLFNSLFGDLAREVRDTSKRFSIGERGRVIDVKIFTRENGHVLPVGVTKKIFITIALTRPITVGDKLTGRFGNKGVVSKILPVEDMPFTADGEPIDVVLNPLGLPSRLNLGQIFELHLGNAAKKLGYQAIVPSFSRLSEEEIKQELQEAGLEDTGREAVYDGRTGEKLAQNISVGYLYLLKLNHLAETRLNMRSIGPYSMVNQQPLKGRANNGGQRIGEMEIWALWSHGAAYNLREILTIKSDDVHGRKEAHESIVKGRHITQTNLPASFNVLLYYLRGLGLDLIFNRKEE